MYKRQLLVSLSSCLEAGVLSGFLILYVAIASCVRTYLRLYSVGQLMSGCWGLFVLLISTVTNWIILNCIHSSLPVTLDTFRTRSFFLPLLLLARLLAGHSFLLTSFLIPSLMKYFTLLLALLLLLLLLARLLAGHSFLLTSFLIPSLMKYFTLLLALLLLLLL